MTFCFVEYENKHLFDFNAAKWTRCAALRWIDDLYLVLSVFGLPGVFDGTRARAAASNWHTLTRQAYEKHLGMKEECAGTCVGHAVALSDAKVSLTPLLDTTRWKLQHGYTARSRKQLLATMVGQLCSVMDRTMNTDPATPLCDFLAHCTELLYPQRLLEQALARLLQKHPYLKTHCMAPTELLLHQGLWRRELR